jgi:hypothetical protein
VTIGRRGLVLTALLLATGCSGGGDLAGGDSAAGRQPGPVPAPPVQASSAAPGPAAAPPAPTPAQAEESVLTAVTRSSGVLELRSVSTGTRESTLLRTLAPPEDGAQVVDVTMSGGADPLVCASWHTGPGEVYDDLETTLVCYAAGQEQGQQLTAVERPAQVAVSRDGRRIAWSLLTQGEQNPVFSTAQLGDGTVSSVDRRRGRADQPDDASTGTDVQDLAWSDDRHVVVSTSVQSDDGPQLLHVDVGTPAGEGWLEEGRVVPVPGDHAGYTTFDSVQSARDGTALADERGDAMGDGAPPDRAVHLDLASGEVLAVVATVAEGRYLVSVSGTPDAAVYVTAAEGTDLKAYLRLRGEQRGTRITGLPGDVLDVLAQG